MAAGIRGEPAVLVPAVTFAGWRGKALRNPRDWIAVGVSGGHQLVVSPTSPSATRCRAVT